MIHRPSTKVAFKDIIKTKTAKRIWIFTHGSKDGIQVGKELLHFEEFKNLNKKCNKEYIMQLQCWGSKELIEYFCDDPSKSEYKYGLRKFEENREFIINTLKKMKKGEF